MKKKTTLCLTVTLVVSMLLGCAGKTNSTQIPIPQATSAEPEASGTTSAAEFTVVTVNSVEPDKDAFVLVNDYIPDIEIDLHYATVNNFATLCARSSGCSLTGLWILGRHFDISIYIKWVDK